MKKPALGGLGAGQRLEVRVAYQGVSTGTESHGWRVPVKRATKSPRLAGLGWAMAGSRPAFVPVEWPPLQR